MWMVAGPAATVLTVPPAEHPLFLARRAGCFEYAHIITETVEVTGGVIYFVAWKLKSGEMEALEQGPRAGTQWGWN